MNIWGGCLILLDTNENKGKKKASLGSILPLPHPSRFTYKDILLSAPAGAPPLTSSLFTAKQADSISELGLEPLPTLLPQGFTRIAYLDQLHSNSRVTLHYSFLCAEHWPSSNTPCNLFHALLLTAYFLSPSPSSNISSMKDKELCSNY